MMNRRLVAVLLICSLWACIASAEKPAKLRRSPDPVFGQYIVVLDEESRKLVSEVSQAIAQEHGARVRSSWNRALVGFSAEMNEAQAEAMTRNPHVVFIEEDSYMYLSTEQLTDETRWNLDRLDQVGDELFSGTFSYGNPGVTVRAYVMDTGVMATHDEFRLGLGDVGTGSSRVEAGVSFVADGYAANAPCSAEPDETLLIGGYGTAVASVLGGRRMGVAKQVRIIPVRTLNCGGVGVASAAIDGLNWILDHYDTHAYAGVVNISNYQRLRPEGLTCPNWSATVTDAELTALEQAVNSVVSWGLPVVVSANNQNVDARCTSPAGNPAAITVGGTMMNDVSGQTVDTRWLNTANPTWRGIPPTNLDPGSNWGLAIDIFAPAHEIRSAHITSTTAERLTNRSGTSFAAPHVAGEVARYLQGKGKSTYNPAGALAYLLSIAKSGVIVATPEIPMNGSTNTLMQSRYTP
ncbi:MAG: S8 family serine peptidase [Thermoanaerobaculia bacterium]|nr:S8 family serine peptidase [Thermoanaerobaculia bacterium]